jgi:hypothetical protein
MRASDSVLDRVWGKPKQRAEHSGPEGQPVEVRQPLDYSDAETRRLVGELLDSRRRAKGA